MFMYSGMFCRRNNHVVAPLMLLGVLTLMTRGITCSWVKLHSKAHMRCRNQDAVGSSLFRNPAITGQGCTYCAGASGTGEGKHLGRSCCPFLQCAGQCRHWFAQNLAGVQVLAAGSRHPFAHPVCDVLLDRKKILLVGRALLCRVSREK